MSCSLLTQHLTAFTATLSLPASSSWFWHSPRSRHHRCSAVYTFPQSAPKASPSASPQAPPQPEPEATDGPPPSSPLPPLISTPVPMLQSSAIASQTATSAATVTAVAQAPDQTLPAVVMLSEGAPEPASRPAVFDTTAAIAAAPAPSTLLHPATAAASAATNPSEAELSQLLQAQQHLPNQATQPAEYPITTSLKSNGTAVEPTSAFNASAATTVATNTTAEPPILTQYGMMYDLKSAASEGSCKTLWQLLQLSPNLTSWADAIEVSHLSHFTKCTFKDS